MTETFDFSEFPTLRSGPVVLRELRASDAAAVFVFRRDAEVQKYNSEPMQDVSQAAELITELRDAYAAHTAIPWALTLPGEDVAIGLFGFDSWQPFHRRADIGYDLAREYWGRGLATAAMGAMLRFAFTRMDLHRVEAQTIADNHGSVRLLRRFGFRLEGQRREHSLENDGTFHDSAIYGLLRREFQ